MAREVLIYQRPRRPSVDVASVERRDHSLLSVTQPLQPPQFPQKFSPHTVPSLTHRRAFLCAGGERQKVAGRSLHFLCKAPCVVPCSKVEFCRRQHRRSSASQVAIGAWMVGARCVAPIVSCEKSEHGQHGRVGSRHDSVRMRHIGRQLLREVLSCS